MTLGRDDLELDDLLSDALVRAVMRADHVEPEVLRSLANAASARLAARRNESASNPRVALFGLSGDGVTKTKGPSAAKRRGAFGDALAVAPVFLSPCLDGF